MRGLTSIERQALIEMTEDALPDEKRLITGWPWPTSVVNKLLKDGRARIFICPHCSAEYRGFIEHIDITPLGKMALRLADVQANLKI